MRRLDRRRGRGLLRLVSILHSFLRSRCCHRLASPFILLLSPHIYPLFFCFPSLHLPRRGILTNRTPLSYVAASEKSNITSPHHPLLVKHAKSPKRSAISATVTNTTPNAVWPPRGAVVEARCIRGGVQRVLGGGDAESSRKYDRVGRCRRWVWEWRDVA